LSERFSRAEKLLGEDGILKLKNARVLLFGVGGVGSFAAEALARAGVGEIELVDNDTVAKSNINRQLIALDSTVGRSKVEVMAERIRDINPECDIKARALFFSAETEHEFEFSDYDYVIDAIDTVSAKLIIAKRCASAGVPLISSMGTAGKLDPTRFRVTDIFETSGCPLARVMRRELRKIGVDALKVVFSDEEAAPSGEREAHGRSVPGSVSFVPPVAGMILAGEVIKAIAGCSDG